MLLTEVECEGYKAFSAPTRMALRPLTVIFGKNNSGKTTLARLPLFVAASLADLEHFYALSVGDIRFGSSFTDLASSDQPHPRIFVRIKWDPSFEKEERPSRSLASELQYVTSGVEPHSVQPRRLIVDDSTPIEFELTKTLNGQEQRFSYQGLSEDDRRALLTRSGFLRRLVRETIHVPSGRARVESTYATGEPNLGLSAKFPY